MKQKSFIVPEHIKEFCKKLFKGLANDGWGYIDPYIFKDIADVDDLNNLEDAYADETDIESYKSLIKILSKILPKPKKGK